MKKLLKRWFEILVIIICLGFLAWLVTYKSSNYSDSFITDEVERRTLVESVSVTGITLEDEDSDDHPLYLQTYISEEDVLRIETDDEVEVSFDAISDDVFTGRVRSISEDPRIVGTETDYEAEITINDFPEEIMKGMHAETQIIIEKHEVSEALPSIAIKKDGDDYYVDKLTLKRRIVLSEIGFDQSKETVEKIKVEIGFEGDEYTEITDGLESGDTVISSTY